MHPGQPLYCSIVLYQICYIVVCSMIDVQNPCSPSQALLADYFRIHSFTINFSYTIIFCSGVKYLLFFCKNRLLVLPNKIILLRIVVNYCRILGCCFTLFKDNGFSLFSNVFLSLTYKIFIVIISVSIL